MPARPGSVRRFVCASSPPVLVGDLCLRAGKGAQVGAHILSGAIIDPSALDALLPEWRAQSAPLKTRVTEDQVLWLGAQKALRAPRLSLPPQIDNRGLYVGSLGELFAAGWPNRRKRWGSICIRDFPQAPLLQ